MPSGLNNTLLDPPRRAFGAADELVFRRRSNDPGGAPTDPPGAAAGGRTLVPCNHESERTETIEPAGWTAAGSSHSGLDRGGPPVALARDDDHRPDPDDDDALVTAGVRALVADGRLRSSDDWMVLLEIARVGGGGGGAADTCGDLHNHDAFDHDATSAGASVGAALPGVEGLDLSKRPLRSIDRLRDCSKLRWLSLDRTWVNDLRPLAGADRLETLSLIGAPVTDVRPIAELPRLRRLYLDETLVEDVLPLVMSPALEYVSLLGAQVNIDHATELQWALNRRHSRRRDHDPEQQQHESSAQDRSPASSPEPPRRSSPVVDTGGGH
ncbi:MAG: hypothetical protein ACF8PN_07580 [Phycisphaerales bacterium]